MHRKGRGGIHNHYFITKPEGENALLGELGEELGKEASIEKLCAQLIKLQTNQDLSDLSLAFALQTLLHSTLIPTGSIAKQAGQINQILLQNPFPKDKRRLHVYALTYKHGIYSGGRGEVLRKKLIKLSKGQFRKINCQESQREIAFDQALILPDRQILLSHLEIEDFHRYGALLSPFIGGTKHIQDDPSPPSRAFKKLKEAQAFWGEFFQPNESVVDLGASPGGWTYVAKERGARVTSVDRSPLTPELMKDPAVTFQKGDAFKFSPETRVDWLISDVVAYPERVLELIERWIKKQKCRKFIITLKFQGEIDFAVLKQIKEKTRAHTSEFFLKQLTHNKHEATLMGKLP